MPVQFFHQDKQSLLQVASRPDTDFDNLLQRYRRPDYPFLSEYSSLFEKEFHQLFSSLKQRMLKGEDKTAYHTFWLYSYYCAKMLEAYHEGYQQPSEAKRYQALADEIKQAYNTNDFRTFRSTNNAIAPSFLERVKASLVGGYQNIVNMPFHVSTFRNVVGMLNLYRIYWIFTRLTLTQLFRLMENSNWLQKFDAFLHQKTDVDKIISRIQAPNPLMLIASVGLFATRLTLHTSMLIKHTCFPSDEEASLTWKQRLMKELDKRQMHYFNDLVWGAVNGVTNFTQFSGLSSVTAGWVTAGFMVFDFSMLIYQTQRDYDAYQQKRQQYELDKADPHGHPELIDEALQKLNQTWEAKLASQVFMMTGSMLIMSGFTAALMITNPTILLSCYFTCAVGVTMYLTGDDFMAYWQNRSQNEAWSEFAQVYGRQLLLPMVSIIAISLSFELALATTLVYFGYEASKYLLDTPSPNLRPTVA